MIPTEAEVNHFLASGSHKQFMPAELQPEIPDRVIKEVASEVIMSMWGNEDLTLAEDFDYALRSVLVAHPDDYVRPPLELELERLGLEWGETPYSRAVLALLKPLEKRLKDITWINVLLDELRRDNQYETKYYYDKKTFRQRTSKLKLKPLPTSGFEKLGTTVDEIVAILFTSINDTVRAAHKSMTFQDIVTEENLPGFMDTYLDIFAADKIAAHGYEITDKIRKQVREAAERQAAREIFGRRLEG